MARKVFNSTLVRLKVPVKRMSSISTTKFQFHTGSIKSPTGWASCCFNRRFNSTLVRLKARIGARK